MHRDALKHALVDRRANLNKYLARRWTALPRPRSSQTSNSNMEIDIHDSSPHIKHDQNYVSAIPK